MSELSWLGEDSTIDEVLIQLGYAKSQIKKSDLSKKQRLKTLKSRSVLQIPKSLFNRFEIFPTYEDSEEKPVVLSEKNDFLAIKKPSYIHSHPLLYSERDNVLSFLRERGYHKFLAPFKNSSYDRGLLFRLDYETSGLLVLCHDEELISRVRNKEVSPTLKSYWAIIEGQYDGPGFLKNSLSTSGKRVFQTEGGREANLEVEMLAYNQEENCSLLKVRLQEGLRHQIRVQLAYRGHPIVGDVLYGARASTNGFGLHCRAYEIDGNLFVDDEFELLGLFNF